MPARNYEIDLKVLEVSKNILIGHPVLDNLKPEQIYFISQSLSLYNLLPQTEQSRQIDDLENFIYYASRDPKIINSTIDFLSQEQSKEQGIKPVSPDNEGSSIPPDLNAIVTGYKKYLSETESSNEPSSVAKSIKKARETLAKRQKIKLVYENAKNQREIDDLKNKRDEYLNQKVDPKSQDVGKITYKTRNVLAQAVASQGGSANKDIIDDLEYLVLSGAIDPSNKNELYTATQIALKEHNEKYDKNIDTIDDAVVNWQKENEKDPFSDKLDSLENEILEAEISTKEIISKKAEDFNREIFNKNKDFDNDLLIASKETKLVQTQLSKSIPNAKSEFDSINPLESEKENFENLIRQNEPSFIRANSESLGARATGMLQASGSNSRNISPEALDLYSKGLTPERLEKLRSNPNISDYLKKHRSVDNQVRLQLKAIHKSKLGQDISKGLSGSSTFEGFNRLSTTAQKVLDPIGTAKSYLNKKVGEYAGKQLLKQTGSAFSQKLGEYILKDGLKEGTKKLVGEAAKKLALALAEKAGVTIVGGSLTATVATALSIPTAGASLIIGAVIIAVTVAIDVTFGFLKRRVNEIKQVLGYTKEDEENDKKAAMIAAGLLLAGFAGVKTGLMGFGIATRAALISAAAIVWLSVATIAVFLTLTFLTAPILSTFVQFDSVEKVNYEDMLKPSSNDCKWPIAPGYQVVEGPKGGTHSRSSLQAIDIWGPDIDGKPILSSTDGIVSEIGNYSNYGNTIQIKTTNAAGSFTVIYGHVASYKVKPQQKVKQGDVIGTVGSTVLFTTPHIHMEYKDIDYNKCPAGGVKIKEGCVGFLACGNVLTK